MDTPTVAVLVVLPFIVALIGAEWGYAAWQGRPVHRGPDMVNDLANALGHFVVTAIVRISPVFAYQWLDELLPTGLTIDKKWLWLATPLLLDFLFYWRHRAMHRIAILWAFHSVHHQANRFNLLVALRLGWLQDLTAWPFLLPLALLGVPVEIVIAVSALDHVYQFLLHTEVIGKVPLVEGILSTPSSHRVHHACNARYIDRNYAGMFAFWDRLFGTWQEEDEAPVYGTTSSIDTWDPVANNVGPLVDLFGKARATATWWDALRVVFGPPGWEPGVGEEPPGEPSPRVVPEGRVNRAIVAAAGVGLVATIGFGAVAGTLTFAPRLVVGTAILVGLWGMCVGMRGRSRGCTSSPSPSLRLQPAVARCASTSSPRPRTT